MMSVLTLNGYLIQPDSSTTEELLNLIPFCNVKIIRRLKAELPPV